MSHLKISKTASYTFIALIALSAIGGVPQKAMAAGGDDYCREYTRTVSIGGRLQDAYGTACLQPDGSWMIVGEDLPDQTYQYNQQNVTYVIHDDRRDFVPTRVIYYKDYHRYYKKEPRGHASSYYRKGEPEYVWYQPQRSHYNRSDRYASRDHHSYRYNNDLTFVLNTR